MGVGIICACMPATAKTYRYLLPAYTHTKESVMSRISILRARITGESTSSSTLSSEDDLIETKVPIRRNHDGLDYYHQSSTLWQGPAVPAQAVKSDIRKADEDDYCGSGIRLTHEVHQSAN